MARALPTIVVAGLAGDTGKTLVSLGIARALVRRGHRVAPFKKGPDFIDAAWLGAAAGRPGRNLDTFLMPEVEVRRSHARLAGSSDIAVVEGNRGLFDGLDAKGSHSTAGLARLLGAPVVLVVDVTKATRTVAAQVAGCRALDPELDLAGVILNRVGTSRQEAVIREAVTEATGLPVLGAVPRLPATNLPSRHLGLVTAVEHPSAVEVLEQAARIVEEYVDITTILTHAGRCQPVEEVDAPPPRAGARVRIGVLRDPAFSFYYPENLEALEAAGAELKFISPLTDERLPAIDALYAGGGFPEVYAAALCANEGLRRDVAKAAGAGLPVWAECGGLMYLSEALIKDGVSYPMAGVLPFVCEHTERPQGHGYVVVQVTGENPFFDRGTELRGHEFHYSRARETSGLTTAFRMMRGTGIGEGRDGVQAGKVVAAYTHLHALGCPDWAPRMVELARPSLLSEDRHEYASPELRTTGHKPASLRERVEVAVRSGVDDEMEAVVARESRAVRYMVSMSYRHEQDLREAAARGIALAARHHPKLVQSIIRRFVWAMNDESGTNALTAPTVLRAISLEQPGLLVPMLPDLIRLSQDEGLQRELIETLQNIRASCPGEIAKSLGDALNNPAGEGAGCEANGG